MSLSLIVSKCVVQGVRFYLVRANKTAIDSFITSRGIISDLERRAFHSPVVLIHLSRTATLFRGRRDIVGYLESNPRYILSRRWYRVTFDGLMRLFMLCFTDYFMICEIRPCGLTMRRSQPPLALAVPLSRFTPRVGGGSAFFVRRLRAYDTLEICCSER